MDIKRIVGAGRAGNGERTRVESVKMDINILSGGEDEFHPLGHLDRYDTDILRYVLELQYVRVCHCL